MYVPFQSICREHRNSKRCFYYPVYDMYALPFRHGKQWRIDEKDLFVLEIDQKLVNDWLKYKMFSWNKKVPRPNALDFTQKMFDDIAVVDKHWIKQCELVNVYFEYNFYVS